MRLFVALDFPDEVRQTLRELIAKLQPDCPGARWARPVGMHITLKFIGETDADKLDAVRAALRTVHSTEPVQMQFRGLGFFPNENRPRVLWCGVEASANLAELAAVAGHSLEPLGFPAEERAFVPHLTLARLGSAMGAGPLVDAANGLKTYDFGSACESLFHLFESVLKPSGTEYTRLESYPFVEGAS